MLLSVLIFEVHVKKWRIFQKCSTSNLAKILKMTSFYKKLRATILRKNLEIKVKYLFEIDQVGTPQV